MKTLTNNLWIIADKLTFAIPVLFLFALLTYGTIKGLNNLLTLLNL